MEPPKLFDRELRRLRRDRAVRRGADAFIHERAFDELLDRMSDVRRNFGTTLLMGCIDPGWADRLREKVSSVIVCDPAPEVARRSGGVVADEDRMPFAEGIFELILSVGTLDSVDDLPGALISIRRALQPDGLFLGVLAGGGSLPRLRSAMLAADAVTGGAAARMHPAIDVRTAGDLLARAGFGLPVADGDGIDVSYAGLSGLLADTRGHASGNVLDRRSRVPLGRRALAAAAEDFMAAAVDGRTVERAELIYLSGWAPAVAAPGPAPGRR